MFRTVSPDFRASEGKLGRGPENSFLDCGLDYGRAVRGGFGNRRGIGQLLAPPAGKGEARNTNSHQPKHTRLWYFDRAAATRAAAVATFMAAFVAMGFMIIIAEQVTKVEVVVVAIAVFASARFASARLTIARFTIARFAIAVLAFTVFCIIAMFTAAVGLMRAAATAFVIITATLARMLALARMFALA